MYVGGQARTESFGRSTPNQGFATFVNSEYDQVVGVNLYDYDVAESIPPSSHWCKYCILVLYVDYRHL